MPEGDVLRLTAARLDRALTGTTLDRVELRWPDVEGARLVGESVLAVEAYGKHLLVRTSGGWTLHTHLRMEGSWRVERTGTPGAAGRSPWVRAVLGGPRWTALGVRLGMLDLVRTRDEHTLLGHLGPDVLADDLVVDAALVVDRFLRTPADRAVPLAEALLDQTRLAGIGTLFAAEGLFARRLDPWSTAGELAPDGWVALVTVVREQMQRSVRDGLAARAVHVHARAGRPCVRCRTLIQVRQARRPPYERPIFYCPRCQGTAGPQPTGASMRR